MSGHPQRPEHAPETITHKSVILGVFALGVSLTFVFKATDFWAILLFPELTRLLQYVEVNSHWQTVAAFRYLGDTLQNLASQMTAKLELALLEPRPYRLPLEIRTKNIFMIGACDISVIIPALNEEKCLPRCLNSLVRQSKEPSEIIVVDGGSVDHTIQVAKEYADKVLVEPARPVGAARNIGAKQAEGEILAFIDADTIASENWLEEIARTFTTKPRAVGVTGPTLPYEGTLLDSIVYRVATGWVQRFSLRLGRPHVAGFNCAYRRNAFWDAEGFDEDRVLLEDVMLSLRMRHQGRIVFNPHMSARTSLRRIERYGYPYLMTYNAINWALTLLFDQTLAYPQVR